MRQTWQRSIICFFVVLVVIQAPIAKPSAQIEGGSISGFVRDASGAVYGAKVTALLETSQPTSKSIEVLTDDEGRFNFDDLPAGAYEVRVSVERSLLKPEAKTNIRVRKSQNTKVDFRLKYVQACDDSSSGPSNVDDTDKAEIIRLMLEDALATNKFPDLLTEGKQSIVLSTKYIKPGWVPNLPGYKLILMSQSEIQKKANSEGGLPYLSFVKFKVRGPCVSVVLANWGVGNLGGGAFNYEYRKHSGKWVGKGIGGVIY